MKHALIVGRRKRRVRRSREEIASVLEEYRSSGLTQMSFAQSKGISLSTFANWLRLERLAGAAGESTPPRLVAVRIKDHVQGLTCSASGSFELSFHSGLRLSIPREFDEESLRRLLPLLLGTC